MDKNNASSRCFFTYFVKCVILPTMEKYHVTIGLEIHAQLKTKTKMFSPSKNDPNEKRANWNISPIDLAHPGTLPLINKKAIEHMIRIGLAVKGDIANYTEFDRKNYFYPDIPKGYQISQYKYPIVSGGVVAGFELERIHLEEDTGTLKHFEEYSLVDFNRAGAPLMELVTKPVLHSSDDVVRFAKELQLILRYLDASDVDIEKGQMRVEVNLSVSKTDKLGTKVEIKNIGSISAAKKATDFEIQRQIEILEQGGKIFQETRGWNEKEQKTVAQRSKENAKDYRYFPEPDLPKLYLHEIFDLDEMRKKLPELPEEKRERYRKKYGLKEDDIEFFVNQRGFSSLFEESVSFLSTSEQKKIKRLSSIFVTSLSGFLKKNSSFRLEVLEAKSLAKLVEMNISGKISSSATDKILLELLKGKNDDPENIAQEKKRLEESREDILRPIISSILEKYPEQKEEYLSGKENILQFFIGMVMKETKGSANPEKVRDILKEFLK